MILPVDVLPQETMESPSMELVEFRDVPLREALNILSAQSGMNIIASSEAALQNVSLTLRDVTPQAALEAIVMANDLWYRRDEETGIIRVATANEYRRSLETFQDQQTHVFTLMYPNALQVAQAIGDLYGARVRVSFGLDQREMMEDLEDRFDRFDLIDEQSQGLGLFGTSTGGVARAGTSGSQRGLFDREDRRSTISNRRVRTSDSEYEIERAEDLMAEEIRALESADNARSDEAAERLLRQRADIYVTVMRNHNKLAVRTSTQSTLDEIESLIHELDVPTPMVLLEVKVMSVQLGRGLDSVFDYQYLSDPGETEGEAGAFARNAILQPPSLNTLIPNTVEGNLVFQIVDEKFRARMQLLEQENRVTNLATPMLLVANNEVSRVFIGEEVPLNRGFSGGQVVVGGDSTIVTPGTTAIEFRPVGTTLMITPNINSDRTVTLRLLQETSNINEEQASVLVPTSNGFVEQQIDVVQSNSLSGTVVARDRLTLAFGGLIRETLADTRNKIPILGDIPIAGVLFRTQETTRMREELIVMIRPYVLLTPNDAQGLSEDLLRELSIHPNADNIRGTLNTFAPEDVLDAENTEDTLIRTLDPTTGTGGEN